MSPRPICCPTGAYLLTLDDGERCARAHGACRPVVNSCTNRVQTLDPATGAVHELFELRGRWTIYDAVPSPDGSQLALLEDGCHSSGTRIVVRDLLTGHSQLVTRGLNGCAIYSDVAWASPTALSFAYGPHPDYYDAPLGCGLATASISRTSGPASWQLMRPASGCGVSSDAYDATGLAVIVGCADDGGGIISTLAQYDAQGQLTAHAQLDGFDPPQYGLDAQLQADPAAGGLLASEIVTDDPDVSDVWTFDGTTLHRVGHYVGHALLAAP